LNEQNCRAKTKQNYIFHGENTSTNTMTGTTTYLAFGAVGTTVATVGNLFFTNRLSLAQCTAVAALTITGGGLSTASARAVCGRSPRPEEAVAAVAMGFWGATCAIVVTVGIVVEVIDRARFHVMR
jgi:hypothetical protein